MKKTIIVSAVNLVEGGPLTVLQECLGYLSGDLASQFEIVALVNREGLLPFKNIKYLEFPKAKKSWLNRLSYEYYYFNKLAKRFNPVLWLSLHDMTPNVSVPRQAVYCHNASPFYKLSFKEAWLDPKFALFNLFYRYLYLINIKRNDFVDVQQNCLRNKFKQFVSTDKIIVAHPSVSSREKMDSAVAATESEQAETIFFYPSLPRVFKNFEVIGQAAGILIKQGVDNFQIVLTISGDENRYSRYIYNSFKHIKNIKFLGIQDRDSIFKLYQKSVCVIFPSKLETWGLPITEAKLFRKPLLLVNLEYAHETLGAYDRVKFFETDNVQQLAQAMKDVISQSVIFEKTEDQAIAAPFTQNWKELFDILLRGFEKMVDCNLK